jgi:sulfhydrogenase subunit beta (sulfur reductase)
MGLPERTSTRLFISQAELNSWLDDLAANQTLIAPRKIDGVVLYHQAASSQEIAWGFSRPVLSIKEVFFPSTERLMTIEKIGQDIHLNEAIFNEAQVVFGVRPCDARGVKLLNAIFLDTSPADPFYARRRDKTALIGLACQEMGPTCFCTSVGGAPDAASDVDVMLVEVNDGYALEIVTTKGRALAAGLSLPAYEDKSPAHSAKLDPVLLIPPVDFMLEHFKDEYWQKISERCLSCRACAYVCPTCRCFSVKDEASDPNEFERIRCWDSCAGENYRRVAGGHQPRLAKGERLRNRVYCKFNYFPEQAGLGNISACTGCGRCIDVCPAGVDITEILANLGRLT